MEREIIPTDIGGLPEVARLAHEVAKTGKRHVLTENGAPVAVLSPARPRQRAAAPEASHEVKSKAARKCGGRVFTRDDALWDIVGMFDDPEGPTDVSSNKHKYLTKAYTPETE
jgi:antitoxin (DNA-binding transcriptional repressor) of toxin-antitoxin stability system